jgi:type II secretory pathway pseudopilin PulG
MKPARLLQSNAGYTYVAAVVTVVILGIMSAQAAQVWKTTMQREKETELIFRGTQFKNAMRAWYGMKDKSTAIAPGRPNLTRLEDLVQDPSFAGKKRYLRKLYKDPMTGEDFVPVKNSAQQVIGVASASEEAPIKQGNFPLDLEPGDFEGKKKYSEWQFRCDRWPKPAVNGGAKLPPGSQPVPVPPPPPPPGSAE